MSAVAVVHEDVHQRAGQQKQEGQDAEEMGAVLAQQEVSSGCAEHQQADGVARAPERRRGDRAGRVVRSMLMGMFPLEAPAGLD
jgi:hypothetical protein